MAAWDSVLGVVASFFQILGIQGWMLVLLIIVHLLRLPQCKEEWIKLRLTVRGLKQLKHMLTGDGAQAATARNDEVIDDAQALLDMYGDGSTWYRIRNARTLEMQLIEKRHDAKTWHSVLVNNHCKCNGKRATTPRPRENTSQSTSPQVEDNGPASSDRQTNTTEENQTEFSSPV